MGDAALPVLLTIDRVAEILSCHPETVRRAIRSGQLGAYRRPGMTRISEDDLARYMESHHCPARGTTGHTWNYAAASGPSSGGNRVDADGYRLGQRMKRALGGH